MLVRSGALGHYRHRLRGRAYPTGRASRAAWGETQVGGQARLMSHALRKLTGTIHKSNASVLFINQIRMKIGNMGYGSPETTSGGNALKFYASVRLWTFARSRP